MTPTDLLAEVRRRGIHVTAAGDGLRLDVPRGALDADLRAALVSQKPALLALLHVEDARSRTPGIPAGRSSLEGLRESPVEMSLAAGCPTFATGPASGLGSQGAQPIRCCACHTSAWWRTRYGLTICRRCHPPAPGAEAADA